MTFGANENRACFSVGILDDSLSEGPESFIARIVSEPSGFDIGIPDTTIISIADDESKAKLVRNFNTSRMVLLYLTNRSHHRLCCIRVYCF